jgi:hypothetical protein
LFVPSIPFHASLVFASKARACPCGAPFRHSPLGQAPGLDRKYYTRLKRIARDKHSSLFGLFPSVEEKSFVTLAPGVNVIKLVSFVADNEAK